jgi:hypothetical protein
MTRRLGNVYYPGCRMANSPKIEPYGSGNSRWVVHRIHVVKRLVDPPWTDGIIAPQS